MRIRSRILTKIVARTVVGLLWSLLRTCRVTLTIMDPAIHPYKPPVSERFIYAIWHDSIIVPIFIDRQPQMSALISRHQDGEYLAETMRILGFGTVRGSSKRGGAPAARQMLDAANNDHLVLTPDGPRGPRRIAKTGAAFMASHTGCRIVPVASSCKKCWRPQGSWTDLVVPRPFTNVYLVLGTPIAVPADATKEQLAHYTERLQAGMAESQRLADSYAMEVRPQFEKRIQIRRAA